MGRTFSLATEEEWKSRAMGGKADGIATLKTPTMQHGTLHNKDVLHEGYWPKKLLYALDELFFIFDQVKRQQGIDQRHLMAYKILCLSMLQCTKRQHGSEKKDMPCMGSLWWGTAGGEAT